MTKIMKQLGILVFIFYFAIIPQTFAASTKDQGQKENGVIQSFVARAEQNVVIDDNIEGTVIATGSTVDVNGNVDGDLIAAGRSVTIRGNVTGNVYVAGATVTIYGKVDKDVFVSGSAINLSENSSIGRDLFAASGTVQVFNAIGRDAYVGSDALNVGSRTQINRNLNIESNKRPDQTIEQKVKGAIHWKSSAKKQLTTGQIVMNRIKDFLITTLSTLLLWALIKFFKPFFWKNNRDVVLQEPLKAAGFGALAILFIPLIGLLLLMTVIGVPMSLFAIGILFLAIFIAKIIVAEVIGKFIFKTEKEKYFGILPVLTGLVILNLIGYIPIIGFIVGFITVLLGVGSIFLKMINDRKKDRENHQQILETHL